MIETISFFLRITEKVKEKQYYITFNVTWHQLLRKRKISCRPGLPQKFVAISTSVTNLWPSRCQLKWRSDPYFPVKNSGTFRIFICSAALVTCFVIPTCLVGSVITLCPIFISTLHTFQQVWEALTGRRFRYYRIANGVLQTIIIIIIIFFIAKRDTERDYTLLHDNRVSLWNYKVKLVH